MAKKVKRVYALRPGSKMARILEWIKAQMVGTELVFTRDHIDQLLALLDVKKDIVIYDSMRLLAERGFINRTKRQGGDKGFIITLPSPNPASTSAANKPRRVRRRETQDSKTSHTSKTASAAGELSVRELMNQLDGDIRRLEVELVEKRAFRKALGQVAGR